MTMTIAIHPRMSWASKDKKEKETLTSIAATLSKARAERSQARLWLTVVPIATGIFVLVGILTAYFLDTPFVISLAPVVVLLILLSMLPSDKKAIQIVYRSIIVIFVLGAIGQLVSGVRNLSTGLDGSECYADTLSATLDAEQRTHCGWLIMVGIRLILMGLLPLGIVVWLFQGWIRFMGKASGLGKGSGPLLDRLYTGSGMMGFLAGLSGIPLLIALIAIDAGAVAIADRAILIVTWCGAGYWCLYPQKLRSGVRTFLLSKMEHGTAASVAGFLGGHSPDHVQATAKELFRGVTLDQVQKDEMAKSEPDSMLMQKTVPATLGEVDAFLSHSWHDDCDMKWDQLQTFRQDFKEAHGGREPMVWIDKYCLDQENLKEGLMCLPVFLAGCSNLLVLAGKTYPRRLWCVMEIFIFLIMGGSESAVSLRLVCDPTDRAERDKLVTLMESFDARDAKCSVQQDEDRMLGVSAISHCLSIGNDEPHRS